MKLLTLLLLPGLCAAADDLAPLITAAQAAPSEFAADSLLRIASVQPNRAPELIAKAFELAAGAQTQYRRRAAIVRPDTPGLYWNRVYNQNLDGLSLRLRAVDAMLPIDAAKAREMFERIPPRRLAPVPCTEYLVYDPGRYYETLGALAQKAEDAGKLLERYATAFTSPVEAGPAARVIARSSVPDDQFQALVAGYARSLSKMTADDRSFTASFALGLDIQTLAEECKRRKLPELPLLESYRVYLVIHLSGARCADNDLMHSGGTPFGIAQPQPAEFSALNPAAFFNEKLRIDPLQPIGELEATPSRLEGVATGLRMCDDAQCRAIQEQFRALVFQPGGGPYSLEARKTPDWHGRFKDFVGALASWKQDGGAAEHFRLKTRAYTDLLGLAPEGSLREIALRAMLDHLERSRLRAPSLMEWFLPVNALIARLTLEGKDTTLLRESKDAVIALYANLERVAPRPVDRLMLLQ